MVSKAGGNDGGVKRVFARNVQLMQSASRKCCERAVFVCQSVCVCGEWKLCCDGGWWWWKGLGEKRKEYL